MTSVQFEWGDNFRVKPNELFMDINGGDKNRVFLHDLIKITEGTVSEGTIFMHIKIGPNTLDHFQSVYFLISFKKLNRIWRDLVKTHFFRKKRHENTTHLNIRELRCEKCDFTTNRPGHLKTHKESIHSGFIYSCNYCDMKQNNCVYWRNTKTPNHITLSQNLTKISAHPDGGPCSGSADA